MHAYTHVYICMKIYACVETQLRAYENSRFTHFKDNIVISMYTRDSTKLHATKMINQLSHSYIARTGKFSRYCSKRTALWYRCKQVRKLVMLLHSLSYWYPWWFLSFSVFELLSSSLLLYSHRFGLYVLRPSSDVPCLTRKPTRNFEPRPLIDGGRLLWFR